jgi:phosphoribosyl-ATP pyrophosphohydrolase/phosphoribosyl-AMP cyclohydrolase
MEKPDFEKMNGLVPAIVQDSKSSEVLMMGFMDEEAFKKTLESGKATFWSRSRKRLWTKGETSGNFLLVESVYIDCDKDAILLKAVPKGPTCHTGNRSCFFKRLK